MLTPSQIAGHGLLAAIEGGVRGKPAYALPQVDTLCALRVPDCALGWCCVCAGA